jgi:hypothetical protein
MTSIVISKQTARRFVLGRQGLWPGRRWKGKQGAAQALRACEAIQLDPLVVIARSQDIVLHSRVMNYKPDHLNQLMYKERDFFDYGGHLDVYPMSELPYWRQHMEKRSHEKRVEDYVFKHPDLFDQVRTELLKRGTLGNRDFQGKSVGAWNYRGRKDTALAMYDMWLSGEIMIHHREGFQRYYDFRENIAPKEFDRLASENEAEDFFARKCIAYKGLMNEGRWKTDLEYYLHRKVGREEMNERLERSLEQGLVAPLRVEGSSEKFLVLGEDIPLLNCLEAGKVPKAWKPIKQTTLEEVNFLAPLDIVSARGRANKLFDFEYLWEVYKPVQQRRWGYYTLPILYGDKLVARLDPKLDRTTMTLQINGFWPEDDAPVKDPAFACAFAFGLIRFAKFLDAGKMDINAILPPMLRKELRAIFKKNTEIQV